jgi:hypothetical protein
MEMTETGIEILVEDDELVALILERRIGIPERHSRSATRNSVSIANAIPRAGNLLNGAIL